MEDTATAEICRAQIWQWLRHGATLSQRTHSEGNLREGAPSLSRSLRQSGRRVTPELVRRVIADQKSRLPGARMAEAAQIYEQMMTDSDFAEFLTLVAYDYID